ncbi:probable 3-beta-hydroxysteroid-Delta(8),Delta(7)-isomerase [Dendrobium catenatum]|uniref:Putative 3-beta-hydroxysteroid-Delta(8),Delta(7)-isomerase n=1 Tax=Dendrobium catenatum TaxID=906689 RepID=A0A2I0WV95_9ASPA|nr:probable 3-beta-hydroxysteroid-Delta(8),Delta(7)-isomerase [Dendrobium catenatum]PKU79553.1 putative 3-beta-hydroxysteroid-Delta(8),Delta(7)-isomerase [Dendrobium catenatum]
MASYEHPYSPRDLQLPGYVPLSLSQIDIVLPYLGSSVVVVAAIWFLSGRFPKLSKTDRLLMCWWAFSGLTHIILEGYFAFVPDFFKKKTPFYLDELWKEYGKGDSRYVSRDSAIVALEGFTAAIEGPACLLVVYAIASRKSYSYILQFAICLGQLYGCMVYFVTSYLDGDNFATSPFYYWAYYVGANGFWVVIATLIAIRSWKKIISVFESGNKKKTK